MNEKFKLSEACKLMTFERVVAASIPHEVEDSSGVFLDEYAVQKRPVLERLLEVLGDS